MGSKLTRVAGIGLLGLIALTACSSAPRAGAAAAAAESNPAPRRVHTPADVDFMSGMIPHHAQAVKISEWAVSHGARREIATLSERVIVSQRDEINMMQGWLRERHLPVPPANATHHRMMMNGVAHDMLMPGMLTDEELEQLDRARGNQFDRLYLTYMIKHHQGAIEMVEKLFATAGAAHQDDVFKFASDVFADQTAEIDRMQNLLATLPGGGVP
jgi:uncharacterized protein (DUF305 family)